MPNHICPRCHYTTSVRTHLIDHLNKKKTCEALYSDVSTIDILNSMNAPKAYQCQECEKSFKTKQNLTVHMKRAHNGVSQTNPTSTNTNTLNNSQNTTDSHDNIENNHTISNSQNTTTTTSSHNTNITNTNSNNSTNNINQPIVNINLNVYGQEKIDHILRDPEFMIECLHKLGKDGIPNLLEKIWLNNEVPENKNVKLKRAHKPKQMWVYEKVDDKEQWVEKAAEEILDQLIQKGTDILVKNNNEYIRLSSNPTVEEQEIYDIRVRRIDNVRKKKRGVYIPIRDRVMAKFEYDKRVNNQANLQMT